MGGTYIFVNGKSLVGGVSDLDLPSSLMMRYVENWSDVGTTKRKWLVSIALQVW
jgi:hypothetical protein